jgi:cytochrome c-type biogenesis protein
MEPGYARSTLFGVTFAAGWTPCIGPLLGTVMTVALT